MSRKPLPTSEAVPILSTTQARATVALRVRQTKHGTATQADVVIARQDLAAASIARAIDKALATAPALTPRQCEVLAGLLRGRP